LVDDLELRIEYMKNDQNKIMPESEQAGSDALPIEVSRAMEMMRRVKTHQATTVNVLPEDQRLPSYFIPEPSFFCPLTA
jgi:hypothetical protein